MTEKGMQLMQSLEQGMLEEFLPEKAMRQIVLNALEVFAKKGLAATKISDIAERAGFSQGFVYNYFRSKDELFTHIVDLAAEGAASTVQKASQCDGTAYEKIFWMTEALLSPDSVAMHHWRLIMVQSATSDALPEEAKRISKEKMVKPVQLLISILTEGQKAGLIVPENPVVLAIAYFSMIQGLGITRMQGGRDMPFPDAALILSFLRTPQCPRYPHES